MIDYKEKYYDLYDSVKHIPRRRLKVHPSEERGDDCGSSLLQEYENSNLKLFLESQKIANKGFVESYCLDDDTAERIRDIRKRLEDNPNLKNSIYKTLSEYLQIPIEQFTNLSLGEQLRLVSYINNYENNLDEKIDQLIYNDVKVRLLKK